jgi:copper chaperone
MQVFSVEGMTCGHCVRAVTQAVQSQDPAASVKVDLAAKEVGVESNLSAEQVIHLITEEGYSAKLACPVGIS